MEGDIRSVRLLLEKGANRYIKEKFNGQTPLDIAISVLGSMEGRPSQEQRNQRKIVELLS